MQKISHTFEVLGSIVNTALLRLIVCCKRSVCDGAGEPATSVASDVLNLRPFGPSTVTTELYVQIYIDFTCNS